MPLDAYLEGYIYMKAFPTIILLTLVSLCWAINLTAAVNRDELIHCITSVGGRSTCVRHGDVNADGQVTAADAQAAFRFALGTELPTADQLCYADCSGDGGITAGDAQGIFGTVLGADLCVDRLPPVDMILIPSGSYEMGSPESPSPELCRISDETRHSVTLTGDFYMQATEVSQWQWESVFGEGSNPSFYRGAYRPVEQITYFDVLIYCNRISVREGLIPCYYDDPEFTRIFDGIPPVTVARAYWNVTADGYRLPTEAEWEYACRGGTVSPYNNGLWNSDCEMDTVLEDIAWYHHTSASITQVVGGKNANAFGLHDMHGNIWEWVWDRYGIFSDQPVSDPTGPETGEDRVVRGGSCCDTAGDCRSASRVGTNPGYAYY